MLETQQVDLRSDISEPLLEIRKLTKRFDGVVAVDQVDMTIMPGERVSLIGPNGSGKTTLFNCVTGFLHPEEGKVIYRNEDITGTRPDLIVLKGISRTFQNVRILPGLTVLDNVMIALQQHQEENLLKRAIHSRNILKLERESRERILPLLERIGLAPLSNELAVNLVYGQRKLLEFACALVPSPSLVMLDEPAAGVNTTMVDRMKKLIMDENSRGTTFLIVEHNMGVVMDISQRITVLDYGRKIAEGTPVEIQQNELVREAYFGR
jgi:ABC-type branched-subunit amino acid transport system ATPase component